MTEIEIKDYRKILEQEFISKDLEIETSLSYISIGSLGFFITINQEFFKLQTACFKWILITSLIFIFISFILLLFRKAKTVKYDRNLMDFLDNMNNDNIEDDLKLQRLWVSNHKKLSWILYSIYICLGTGIGLQILFLSQN